MEAQPDRTQAHQRVARSSEQRVCQYWHTMPGRQRIAFAVYLLPTVGLLVQGLLYLTTSRFMPYHADALGTAWEALPTHYQGFLLGVLKSMGAGSVCTAGILLVLLGVPFRHGQPWAQWVIPLLGIAFTSMTLYAALTIATRTPASPPWGETIGLIALYLLGAVLLLWPTSMPRSRQVPHKESDRWPDRLT